MCYHTGTVSSFHWTVSCVLYRECLFYPSHDPLPLAVTHSCRIGARVLIEVMTTKAAMPPRTTAQIPQNFIADVMSCTVSLQPLASVSEMSRPPLVSSCTVSLQPTASVSCGKLMRSFFAGLFRDHAVHVALDVFTVLDSVPDSVPACERIMTHVSLCWSMMYLLLSRTVRRLTGPGCRPLEGSLECSPQQLL